MSVRRIGLAEAKQRLSEGYTYLDIRSEDEFAAGHIPGAYNVPLFHLKDSMLEENPEFLAVVAANFPKTAPLLIGCQSGRRSQQAAQILAAHGYEQLEELRTGFNGCRDAFGRLEPGWERTGEAIEAGSGGERAYSALSSLLNSGN